MGREMSKIEAHIIRWNYCMSVVVLETEDWL